MLTVQSPATGNHLPRPKLSRRPLQPITSPSNIPPPPPPIIQKPLPNPRSIQISHHSNNPIPNPKPNNNQNEKRDPVQIEQFEVSLADELSAIRSKMERLKADKDKTEKMLKQRELIMEMKMKELNQRGEIQKVLEIEVDRLYRLNELRSLCNRILPIRSLREKEHEKIKPDKLQGVKVEEKANIACE